MRNLVPCLVFTTLTVTYSEGAPGAGSSSKGELDVVTASVRVLREGEVKALATLCTPKYAFTAGNQFTYTQAKMNIVNIYIVTEDFNGKGMCSRHHVKDIKHEDCKLYVALAIIILTDPIAREDIFIPKFGKIYSSLKKNYHLEQYLGVYGTVVLNEEKVINETTQEKKFIPRKYPEKSLNVLGDLYITYFRDDPLETGSEYVGGFLLVKHKDEDQLVGIVNDAHRMTKPDVITFMNLEARRDFILKSIFINTDDCSIM